MDTPGFDWFLKKLLVDRTGFDDVLDGRKEIARKAAEFIWRNIQDVMDVDSIVDEVSVSRRTLERYFRKQYGLTICEVIAVARLELAKWLLTETLLPIHAVATEAGYSSSDWMGKVIRRDTGATPSRYRVKSR